MSRVFVGITFVSLLLMCSASAAWAHGLLTSTPVGPTSGAARAPNPVALASHKVRAVVDGPVADVSIEQVFRNRSDRQLEGTYLFPLPEGAAVSGFAMTLGGKMVQGEVLEATQARQIYESIVRRRRDPGLLEYLGRGLYRAKVFPIPPRGDVTIRLSFQQVLPEHDGTLEFRYPLATDRLHGEPVEETVLTVDVKSDVDVKAVYSPSHDVAVVRRSDREVQASYERTHARQARDFLLHVGRSTDRVGLTLLSHKAAGEDGTFLAVLAPQLDRRDLPVVPKDVVFVLDVSGSMGEHAKIAQAKRALQFGVSVLRPEDRFDIVTFSTMVRSFREGLVPASSDIKAAARSWIESLTANGGTNIDLALKTGLSMGTQDRLFQVVFLTDGQPTVGERDPEKIVEGATWSNVHHARVFTFGVGFDLDVKLLDRIAEATRGARDYVMPKEELEIATSRFFKKVTEPALTDVSIDLGGRTYDVYPSTVPDLFSGGQVVLMGRYPEPGRRTVRLKGRLGEKAVEYVFEASFADAERAAYLPRLWANRKVAFLLDQIRLNGEEKELVDEVVRLGTRYAIVTPYTAGLVTEDEELEAMRSASPLFGAPRRSSGGGRGGGGPHGQFRGPGDSVPPGLREPADATPPPPPPPSGPPPVPTPGTPVGPATPSAPAPTTPPAPGGSLAPAPAPQRSKRLKEDKERSSRTDGVHVKLVAGRTFRKEKDGRWVDTAWDGKKQTTKVEAFSKAWTDLLTRHPKLAKVLALGEKVVFVLGDEVYEIVPPKGEETPKGD